MSKTATTGLGSIVMFMAFTGVYLLEQHAQPKEKTMFYNEIPSDEPIIINLDASPLDESVVRNTIVLSIQYDNIKKLESSATSTHVTEATFTNNAETTSKNDIGSEVEEENKPMLSSIIKPVQPATRDETISKDNLVFDIKSEIPNDINKEYRENIKEMMKHAWDNYVRYAWGKNELKPFSKTANKASIFGNMPLGATIIDGLDTLYIMGMTEEFKQGRDWVANELDIDALTGETSVFEANVRLIGGLLSCFSFTGDVVFRDKALEIANKLLPAFETSTGIPHALVNLKYGASKNYGWASGGCSILSEFGTLHLEFAYLSDVTGNTIFRNKVDHIRKFLQGIKKPNGLYPTYLHPRRGTWGQNYFTMGAQGDSFFEYLLKAWIQSNKEDNEARQMYDDAMQAVIKHMLFTSKGGLTYFAELMFDRPDNKMDQLACFTGGLLGLGANTLRNEISDKYMDIAKNITETCHESCQRSNTKLGPDSFRFLDDVEARAVKTPDKYYILRPEVIESYFYLYRLTKDNKYREWGWEAVQALEKHCRVPGGYTGIRNVYSDNPVGDDVQRSFFLAGTLKYLYLLFSDDSLVSLDEWLFNTEAHPLPIKDVNAYYRKASV